MFIFTICTFIVFAKTTPKDFKKVSGKWQLVEIQETRYYPNGQHSISKQSTNVQPNIKEYDESELTFKKYNYKNDLVLEGTWSIGDNRLVETVTRDHNRRLRNNSLNAFDYEIKKDKLIIKYNSSSRNDLFIKETWKKIK